jgi:ankyrin repeat protein
VLNSARKSVEEDFLLACESGSAQRVREIIASQHIQVKEVWGMGKIGPLHLASGGGHLDVCRILVEEVGVNVNAPTKSFETALHQAAYRGQCEVIEYLLLHGAVIDAKNQVVYPFLV